jgi:mannosyltransferase
MHRNIPQFLRSPNAVFGLLLVVTTLVVRLIDLDLDSLWFDEVFSVRAAQLSAGELISLTSGDVHPPLYYLLLHFWIKCFGETETAVRMLSVCFSVFTVFAVYQLALTLFDRRTAVLAGLFIALSPFHVFYAQEARNYSLLAFLSAASVYFFIRWLREDARTSWVLYVITTVLLLYTHIYAVFVVMAQVLYLGLLFVFERDCSRQRMRRWSTGLLAIALLFSPWLVIVFRQVAKARQGYWIKETDWLAPLQTVIEYSGSLWLALLLLPLFVYGVLRCCGSSSDDKKLVPKTRAFLLIWSLVPILVPFLISKLVTPFYLAKFTIAASLPFYLFAAVGLNQIRRTTAQVSIVLAFFVVAGLVLKNDLTSLKRERWRDAAYNVEQSAQSGDLVLFNSTGSQLSFDYYARRDDLVTAVFPYTASDDQAPTNLELLRRTGAEGFRSAPPHIEQETNEKARTIVGARRRVWLVTRYDERFRDDFNRAFGNAFRVSPQPPLCFQQRRFLFREAYSETDSVLVLEQRGLSCAPQVYLFERQ